MILTQLKILLENEPAMLFQASTDVLRLKLLVKIVMLMEWFFFFPEIEGFSGSTDVKISSLNHGTMWSVHPLCLQALDFPPAHSCTVAVVREEVIREDNTRPICQSDPQKKTNKKHDSSLAVLVIAWQCGLRPFGVLHHSYLLLPSLACHRSLCFVL